MTLEELSVVYKADVAPALQNIRLLSRTVMQAADAIEQSADRFYTAGQNLSQSLAAGILSKEGKVMDAAGKIARSAAEALQSALQIHSPSKVTMDIGKNFSTGLEKGILGSAAQVERAAFSKGNSASPAFSFPTVEKDAAFSAPREINLTVPVEVDGYQLGVAAVSSINKLTRATGRAEISL